MVRCWFMQHLHVTNMVRLTLLCEVDPVCFESDGATENKVVVEDPPVWEVPSESTPVGINNFESYVICIGAYSN